MSVFKRVSAFLTAVGIACTCAACGHNTINALTVNGVEVPAGVYIYYANSAYNQALSKLKEEDENIDTTDVKAVKAATLEGKDVLTWVQDEATKQCAEYVVIEQKFDELGLELEYEDKSNIEAMMSYYWDSSKDSMEKNGISEASFEKIVTSSYKSDKIFQYYYAVGGENGVTDDDVYNYYKDNNIRCEYIAMALKDGEGNLLKSDGKKEIMEIAEGYQKRAEDALAEGGIEAVHTEMNIIREDWAYYQTSVSEAAAGITGDEAATTTARSTTTETVTTAEGETTAEDETTAEGETTAENAEDTTAEETTEVTTEEETTEAETTETEEGTVKAANAPETAEESEVTTEAVTEDETAETATTAAAETAAEGEEATTATVDETAEDETDAETEVASDEDADAETTEETIPEELLDAMNSEEETTTTDPLANESIISVINEEDYDDPEDISYNPSEKTYKKLLDIQPADYGKAYIVEEDEDYYLVIRYEIEDRMNEDDLWTDSTKENVIYSMFNKEFTDLLDEWADSASVVRNEAAYKRYDPYKFDFT